MKPTLAMFKASLLSILRDRQLLVGAMAFPVIFLLAFAAFDLSISGTNLGTGGDVDYYNFVVPGLLAMTGMEFAVSWTSASYARYKETKVLRRLEATPIRQSAFMTGQVAARVIVGALQAVTVLAVATLLGAEFAGNPAILVALTILAGAVFMPLGFAIGARASGVEATSVFAGMVVLPVVFLSGAFFPVSGLPDWLQPLVEALPMAPLMEAMRAVAIGGGTWGDIVGSLSTVFIWVPIMFLIATVMMRRPSSRKTRRHLVRPSEPLTSQQSLQR